MPAYKKRGDRVTAVVRYKGVEIVQTFTGKEPAKKWALEVELAIDRREWPRRDLIPVHLHGRWFPEDAAKVIPEIDDSRPHAGWSLDRALLHYMDTVKSNSVKDCNRINWWRRQRLGGRAMNEITLGSLSSKDLQAYIRVRKESVKANTIRNDVFMLGGMYTHAKKPDSEEDGRHGWGLLDLANPVDGCALPPQPKPRKRRLRDGEGGKDGEEARILQALGSGLNPIIMIAAFRVATETGMRLGEVREIKNGWVVWSGGVRTVNIPPEHTKNGDGREVVLSSRAGHAVDELTALLGTRDAQVPLIPLTEGQLEYRWKRAREAAGIEDLRWHDLRHEGASRLAGMGLTIGELKNQTGHRSTKILLDYVNALPSEIARKIK